MGSSGSSQQSSNQSISQVQLPEWVNQAAQQNYALAQNVANQPLTQYQGQQVADIGPQTQQAWNLAAGSGGAGADQYNAAQAGFLTAAATPATQVTPQSLASTNLQPYMDPYAQSVINTTLPLMQQQLGQTLATNAGNAVNQGAFGGSRFGVQQGAAQAQGALNMGQMAAQLNQANFGQAQAAATGDITRNLQAQTSNQGANQAAINSMIQAASGLGTLGEQAQQNQRQQFLELATAGAQQQQQAQSIIDQQKAKFSAAQAYPGNQLGVLQSALGMTPYGSTTMGASQGQQETQQQQGFGDVIMGGLQSLGGMFSQGGPFGAGGVFALAHNRGTARVPGPLSSPSDLDIMPAALAPGEAVLNREAAQRLGRGKIAALNQSGLKDRAALDAVPAIRPSMPGAGVPPMMRVPGALAPTAPAGLTGALGATMRPPRMRRQMRTPRVAGALGG